MCHADSCFLSFVKFSLFLGDIDVCKLKDEQSKALVDKKEASAKRNLSPPRKRGLFSFVRPPVRPMPPTVNGERLCPADPVNPGNRATVQFQSRTRNAPTWCCLWAPIRCARQTPQPSSTRRAHFRQPDSLTVVCCCARWCSTSTAPMRSRPRSEPRASTARCQSGSWAHVTPCRPRRATPTPSDPRTSAYVSVSVSVFPLLQLTYLRCRLDIGIGTGPGKCTPGSMYSCMATLDTSAMTTSWIR